MTSFLFVGLVGGVRREGEGGGMKKEGGRRRGEEEGGGKKREAGRKRREREGRDAKCVCERKDEWEE